MLYHINPRTNLVNFSLLLEIFTSLRILCAFVHAWFFPTWFREKYSITSKIIWNYQWYEIDFTTSPVVFLRSEGGEVNLLRVIRIWKLIWTLLKRERYFKKRWKELSSCHKLGFSNPYIFKTRRFDFSNYINCVWSKSLKCQKVFTIRL